MLEAVILDFDGVVVDSEPMHMRCFQELMRQRFDVEITPERYMDRYIACTDHDALLVMNADFDLGLHESAIGELIEAKAAMFEKAMRGGHCFLPGALPLMRAVRDAGLALAICSGAIRQEIEQPLAMAGALYWPQVIVAAEDVVTGKPDPQGYTLARQRLSEITARSLDASVCLAIEDSPGGAHAAKAAGLFTVGVTNTVPAEHLAHTDRVIHSLADITVDDLRAWMG